MTNNQMSVHLCVLGDGRVGKSALTIQYFQGHFVEDWDPTHEDVYRRGDIIDGTRFDLFVQDTAGQEHYEAIRETYIQACEGFLIVYDAAEQSTEQKSFQNVDNYFDCIKQHHPNAPILLVANKTDLRIQRKITTEQGEKKAREKNIDYMETSAKTKHNVTEAFHSLCKKCILRKNDTVPELDPFYETDDRNTRQSSSKWLRYFCCSK